LDFLRPTTREYGEGAVQAFLGLLNYRRFGQGIAKVLRPLMAALHGDKSALDEVPWSPGMDAAFSSSKKALDSPLLLYMIACEINCHIQYFAYQHTWVPSSVIVSGLIVLLRQTSCSVSLTTNLFKVLYSTLLHLPPLRFHCAILITDKVLDMLWGSKF
jgi:hypothetical protein